MASEKEWRAREGKKFSPGEERREDGKKRFKMLPKKNRLQKKKDIDDVFRKGETRKSSLFIVKIKNNSLFI